MCDTHTYTHIHTLIHTDGTDCLACTGTTLCVQIKMADTVSVNIESTVFIWKSADLRQTQLHVLDIKYSRCIEILRYANRHQNLDDHRLPKIIRNWEISRGGKGWWGDLVNITRPLHLPDSTTEIEFDLDTAKASLKSL